MKKTILVIVALFYTVCVPFAQGETIRLKEKGKIHLYRYLTDKAAYPVYKTDQGASFFIPSSFLNFQNLNDTLQFLIYYKDDSLKIELADTTNGLKNTFSSNELRVWNHENSYKRQIGLQKNKDHLSIRSYYADQLEIDTSFGYLTIDPNYVHYAKIDFDSITYNIAIHDKNKNGRMEEGLDLLALSEDEFFITCESRKSALLKKENFIRLGNHFIKLTWDSGFEFLLEEVEPNKKVEAIIDNKLENIKIDTLLLSEIVNKSGYTLINIWSVYCNPCIEAIPELNMIKNHVIGLCLKDDFDVVERFGVEFNNYWISQSQSKMLNVFSNPNYVIVDKELNIHSRHTNSYKAFTAFQELINK
jgi:hypothetical protein